MKIFTVDSISLAKQFCDFSIKPIDEEQVNRESPDLKIVLFNDNKQILGRTSIWWKNIPLYSNYKVGYIGHFAVIEDTKSAVFLLNECCKQLAKHGCTLAIGPIDGSTWGNYRLITNKGKEPLFFSEIENPFSWPQFFENAKFKPLSTYCSLLCDNLSTQDLRLHNPKFSAYISELLKSIQFRQFNLNNFDYELDLIYQLSMESFKNNFLFTPISKDAFITQYTQYKSIIRPEFIEIAEYQNEVVGFIFAFPDYFQQKRIENIDTLIIKTLAVKPQIKLKGLGGILLERMHNKAKEKSFKKIIHAFIHEKNYASLKLCKQYGKKIRSYTLFQREL